MNYSLDDDHFGSQLLALATQPRSFSYRHCFLIMNVIEQLPQSSDASQRTEDGSAGSSSDALVDGVRTSMVNGVEEVSTTGKSDLLKKIEDLRTSQRQLRQERKRCAQDMKNAMRKKKRLQNKAGLLSDGDLVEVLRMRQDKKKELEQLESGNAKK